MLRPYGGAAHVKTGVDNVIPAPCYAEALRPGEQAGAQKGVDSRFHGNDKDAVMQLLYATSIGCRTIMGKK